MDYYYYIRTLAKNYLDDGIIHYKVKGRKKHKRFTHEFFDYLEEETGINFKSTRKNRKSEMDIAYVDEVTEGGGWYAGYAYTYANGSSSIQVEKGLSSWKSTLSHEVAHGLGLLHDHETRKSITSYMRDYDRWEWYAQDLNYIDKFYGPHL